jgi:hypothetical protein
MPTLPSSLERETGYVVDVLPDLTNNPLFAGLTGQATDETEHATELRYPLSIPVYDQMRTEAKVAAVEQAVSLPILRSRFRVNPNGARPDVVQHVAEDLGLPILGQTPDGAPVPRRRGRFSFRNHLALALLSGSYGHMVFAQKYRIEGTGPNGHAGAAGQARPADAPHPGRVQGRARRRSRRRVPEARAGRRIAGLAPDRQSRRVQPRA